MTGTHPRHLASATELGILTREVAWLSARRDGNNVQLDRELLAVGSAAGEFKRAATAFEFKLRQIRYAINDGR